MGKTLIIAEKPSVATDLAKVLKVTKDKDFFENDQYIITSAVGHLVSLEMPEDIDKKKYGFWSLKELPIIPETFGLKAIDKTKSQFNLLKTQLKRKDVDCVINACDAGREGELIFAYIYELAASKKPIKRLWMQSMTKDAILKAFDHLKDENEIANLRDAAKCRSEADWLIGLNATRAVTKRTCPKGQTATVGRVQTPTLALICQRENEIRNFTSRDYWKIQSRFSLTSDSYTGTLIRPDFSKNTDDKEDKIDRIFDRNQAEQIYQELNSLQGQKAQVSDIAKRTRKGAPQLFDLTSLQREANNRFGYSATRTLQIAQALYETHKMLTYPRTDSRALPEDYLPTCREILAKLDDFQPSTTKILNNNWVKPDKRIFDNKKISDHFAIIPTGESKKLDTQEQNIYDLVTRRFIAVFFPPAEFDETERTTTIQNYTFKTFGKVLVIPGWMEVYGKSNQNDNDELPPITANDGNPPLANLLETYAEQLATKPPVRYSEATLLSAMEHAGKMVEDEELASAMKEKGLGTPATRASIIEKLCDLDYLQRMERSLIPTLKAENLIDFLARVDSKFLTQAELTGEWEYKLNQIENGLLSRGAFMHEISHLTADMIDKIKNWEDHGDVNNDLISFTDGKPMLEKARNFVSEDGTLSIYKVVGNRQLSNDEIKELLSNKRIGPFHDFRSKFGKPFSASIIIGEDLKVQLEFAAREDSTPSNPQAQEEVKLMINLMKDIQWEEPEKATKRVGDKAFYESLKKQAETRTLSDKQVAALKKILEKYSAQINDYDTVSTALNLQSAADKSASNDKIIALFDRLATIQNWEEPTGKGRAAKDDQKLCSSFKSQFEKKNTLSDKQVAAMEKLAEKYSV